VTVGILGGGQLGRMLALAGYPLGLRSRFLDPDPACPAAHLGELVVGAYDDEAALERFARGVSVATYEFENVPSRTARWLTEHVPVHPPEHALATAQDRLAEKTCFRDLGIPTPAFEPVSTLAELHSAAARLGLPAVLKTRRFGYDGKGQAVLRDPADIAPAWSALGGSRLPTADLILEAFVPFARELSVIGVRAVGGTSAFYPPIENVHASGILARSTAPAPGVSPALAAALTDATRTVMDHLAYVGVLTIEYFDLGDGRFLANEMAPRVHNSGHWSIEGAHCSQFENHLRAVAGLPLGPTAPRGHSVMLNIIGDDPDAPALLALPGAHLHLYAKAPRPGRKLGHVTLCADSPADAAALAARAAQALRNC
jgi:5-(carboxyamino)imidazole ribonucleotide synthase